MVIRKSFISLCIVIIPLCYGFQNPTALTKHATICKPRQSFKKLFHPNFSSPLVRYAGNSDRSPPSQEEISALEREVFESTRSRLDIRRVNEAFFEEEDELQRGLYDSWKVALAAGLLTSLAAGMVFHSVFVSAFACVAVFVVAIGDPIDETSAAGALARVVGRFTLKTVAQPKVKAIARAAVRGNDEVFELRELLRDLEAENEELYLWKRRRIAVDEALNDFNVDELKEIARENKIRIGGTKSQLLMRLVEAEIVDLRL